MGCDHLVVLGFFGQDEMVTREATMTERQRSQDEKTESAERAQQDRDHEYRMRELEVWAVGQRRQDQRSDAGHFSIASQVKLVPEFTESCVDTFFYSV